MTLFKRSVLPIHILVTTGLLFVYDATGEAWLYLAVGVISSAATGIGTLIHHPAQRLPWIFLTLGMAVWTVGDFVWFAPGIEGPATYPSAADVPYLIGYPCFIIALGALMWAGEKDFRKAGVLDIGMITTAIGIVVWIKGVAPTAELGMLNAPFLISAVYLVLDLLLVGVATKLLLTRSRRTISSTLLALGLLALLLADLTSWMFVPEDGSLLMFFMDSSWLISYVAVGAAALHPSMAEDNRSQVEPDEHLTKLRMVLLAVVAVVGPLLLIPDTLDDNEVGLTGVTIGIALFFVLTLLRMSGLFHNTQQINEALIVKSEKLRRAEMRYRTIVEQTPAVTFMGDGARGRMFTFASPQSHVLLGYAPDELTNDPGIISRLIHEDDVGRVGNALAEGYLTGEFSTDTRMIRKDGTVIWAHIQAALLGEPGNETWHGVLLDISDRQKVEELEHALAIEREAVERLKRLDEMKTTFLQAVSHELRTPLTSIKGLAATINVRLDELTPDETKDLAGRIDNGVGRLEQLLADLLDVDRLSRGVFMPQCVPSNVGEIARRMAEGLELDDVSRMHIETSEEIAVVDPSKIERIMENLCSNARKHTPPGTQIWVSVGSIGDEVSIEVADSGSGVPDEIKESIFDPFNQGVSPSAHSQGLGLGLSLVRKFAELHGGRAWVEDRPGGGACFKVTLPRVPTFKGEEVSA